jgi:hypothetical protein
MNRRTFIKVFGVALAGWIVSRQNLPHGSRCCSDLDPWQHEAWAKLRQCWLDLDGQSCGQTHQIALDELVRANQIEPEVAEQIRIAYDAASYRRPLVSCYFIGPSGLDIFAGNLRSDLYRQRLILLDEMSGYIDPITLEHTREEIAQDMVVYGYLEKWDTLSDLEQSMIILESRTNTVDISPEALKAANTLIELLAGWSE